jgi:DNA modification methylase
LSPFAGIGSEIYKAVEMGRKGIGFELKPSYFKEAVKNCTKAMAIAKTEKIF